MCVGVIVYKDSLSCDRLQHTSSSGKVVVRALCFVCVASVRLFIALTAKKGNVNISGEAGDLSLFFV